MTKNVNNVMIKTTFAELKDGQRFFMRDHSVHRKYDHLTYSLSRNNGDRDYHKMRDPNAEVCIDVEE